MNKKLRMKALCFILIIYTIFAPLSISTHAEECVPALSDDTVVGSRFWELFFGEEKKEPKKEKYKGDNRSGEQIFISS